jgi:hypothetical protein
MRTVTSLCFQTHTYHPIIMNSYYTNPGKSLCESHHSIKNAIPIIECQELKTIIIQAVRYNMILLNKIHLGVAQHNYRHTSNIHVGKHMHCYSAQTVHVLFCTITEFILNLYHIFIYKFRCKLNCVNNFIFEECHLLGCYAVSLL